MAHGGRRGHVEALVGGSLVAWPVLCPWQGFSLLHLGGVPCCRRLGGPALLGLALPHEETGVGVFSGVL